jgi:hydrogenase maturation protease
MAFGNPDLAISKIDLRSSKLLIFDAVEAGKPPGSIIFSSISDTQYGFFVTHNLPLKVYPAVRQNVEHVSVLGVEPNDVGIGEELSDVVGPAADRVVEEVTTQLEEIRDD